MTECDRCTWAHEALSKLVNQETYYAFSFHTPEQATTITTARKEESERWTVTFPLSLADLFILQRAQKWIEIQWICLLEIGNRKKWQLISVNTHVLMCPHLIHFGRKDNCEIYFRICFYNRVCVCVLPSTQPKDANETTNRRRQNKKHTRAHLRSTQKKHTQKLSYACILFYITPTNN